MHHRPHKRPTAVDLFCGVGGLSLGLVQTGFDLIGAVDNDRTVLDAFRLNFAEVPTASHDLSVATGSVLQCDLSMGKRDIDLLVGGPPCQGFSFGGVNKRADPRNEGVLVFARLVKELRPRYFVMENVRGFLSAPHTSRRKEFCKAVTEAGYVVQLPIRALNAADYGVPQRRLRAFIVGHARGEVAPDYPPPNTAKTPTVRDAIGDLTFVDRHSPDFGLDHYEGPLGPTSAFASDLRRNPTGDLVRRLTGCRRTRHSSAVVQRFRATKPGNQEIISRFYRLAWGGISPTLRAGTGRDHGSHTAPRPIHPAKARCITVREAARLHSFPDWFTFHPTHWHGFQQIGNSVPPLLAKAVVSSIYAALTRSG